MNTIQNGVASAAAKHAVLDVGLKQNQNNVTWMNRGTDSFKATAANDEVVAKVLSNSIGSALVKAGANSASGAKVTKLNTPAQRDKLSTTTYSSDNFDIDTVANNVVGFVQSAIAKLAQSGITEEQIKTYKSEAAKGIAVGVEQAKQELSDVGDEALFKTVDLTKTTMLKKIEALPLNPSEYIFVDKVEANPAVVAEISNTVSITDDNNVKASVEFSPTRFDMPKDDSNTSFYTSNALNVSFMITGASDEASRNRFADLINKLDGVANNFYRNDISEQAKTAQQLGNSDQDIMKLAKRLLISDRQAPAQLYNQFQNMSEKPEQVDNKAVSNVANYVNQLNTVFDASEKLLRSDSERDKLINGLLNQVKDIQVPDIISAINRFKSFNARFF